MKKRGAFPVTREPGSFPSWLKANKELIRSETTRRLGEDHLLSVVLNRKSIEEDDSFD